MARSAKKTGGGINPSNAGGDEEIDEELDRARCTLLAKTGDQARLSVFGFKVTHLVFFIRW